MKILISNDDGYLAPGITALAKALTSIAEVTVVAPDKDRSGSSNALTLGKPLSVQRSGNGFYFVNGTPSDCVHIALTGLLNFRPDLIVSGINQGGNMAEDTLYSGTVAAATEGFLFGISSIAFSQVQRGWIELESAVIVAQRIVEKRFNSLPNPYLLNVNIPNLPCDQLKSTVATRLGERHESKEAIHDKDSCGNDVYWIGLPGSPRDASKGTDFYAVSKDHVSITPLHTNLTCKIQLDALKEDLL